MEIPTRKWIDWFFIVVVVYCVSAFSTQCQRVNYIRGNGSSIIRKSQIQ